MYNQENQHVLVVSCSIKLCIDIINAPCPSLIHHVAIVLRGIPISFCFSDIRYLLPKRSQSDIHDKLFFLGIAHMTGQNSLQTIVNNNKTATKPVK